MIGVMADDLTGAAEVGGVAWRYGLSSEVHTAPTQVFNAEVVAIDTDTRGCSGDEAARRVKWVATPLRKQGWIYKKVDSVLRGPVLAELEAVLAALRLNRALVVPANPGLGRGIRDGHYFVAGKPINETDFRNDPHHPRVSSHVLEMLGPRGSEPVFVCRPDQALPPRGIVVGEVGSRADLVSWAAKLDETILPVGGAEFFSAILETNGHKLRSKTVRSDEVDEGDAPAFDALDPNPIRMKASRSSELSVAIQPGMDSPSRSIFVCGSAASSAMGFLSECRKRGLPVLGLPPDLMRGAGTAERQVRGWAEDVINALKRHSQVVVAIDKPWVQEVDASQRLGKHLIDMVMRVMEREKLNTIYVEGGATAAALVHLMGWSRLKIMRELAPGVVTMGAGGDRKVTLTIKPGSYTWPVAVWQAR